MTNKAEDTLDKILDEYFSDRKTAVTSGGTRTTAHRRAVRKLEAHINQARIDELKRILKGQKTVTQYADPDFKDLITYVFSADEINDRIKSLSRGNDEQD